MADGILLEREGVPAVAIVTEPFRITAEAMAKAYGFPGFQHLLLPHPVASLTAEEIAERVESALPAVLAILGIEQ